MGQKVNPVGIRLGITVDWKAKWFTASKRTFADLLIKDSTARKKIKAYLDSLQAGVSCIKIERSALNSAQIAVHVARPGVISREKGGGDGLEKLRNEVSKIMGIPVHIHLVEVKKPELDAQLVAENIAQQLERRVMYRRAVKKALQTTMRAGAKGIKVAVGGRLNGAEIARTEWYREGRVPLHTFRADIDYALAEAKTTYGVIGVKVWIFKGEVIGPAEQPAEVAATAEA